MPGIVNELSLRGSTRVRFARDIRWFHHRIWAIHGPSELTVQTQSRGLLESVIRERLMAVPGVEVRAGTDVVGLASRNHERVTGVELQNTCISADVVVDASGRGSRLPAWLEQIGYAAPVEERVHMDLGYASRVYTAAADGLPEGA